MGYIIGKISYQEECRKKIMQLENSPLAAAMRKGHAGRGFIPDMAAAMGSIEDTDIPQEGEAKALRDEYTGGDIDVRNIELKGLDEHLRPSVDNMDRQIGKESATTQQQNYTSYEDLRQKNRSEYDRKASLSQPPQSSGSQPSDAPGPAHSIPPSPSRSYAWDTPTSASGARRNQYGDIVEE